jgi:hypothetical protein
MLRPAQVRYLIADCYDMWHYWTQYATQHPIIAPFCRGNAKAYQHMYWDLLLMTDNTEYYQHGNGD